MGEFNVIPVKIRVELTFLKSEMFKTQIYICKCSLRVLRKEQEEQTREPRTTEQTGEPSAWAGAPSFS